MKGMEELIFGIRAGYPFFYCESQEIGKTTKEITEGLKEYYKESKKDENLILTWDFEYKNPAGESVYNDPDSLMTMLENCRDGVDSVPPWSIVVAKNYNWFLSDQRGYGSNEFDKAKIAWLLNRSGVFSSPEARKTLVIVGSISFNDAIPDPLKKEFGRIEFPLPDDNEIKKIYDYIVDSGKESKKFKIPDKETEKRIIAGAKGLTSGEITKVFSYSIIKGEGFFDPRTVEELRSEEINSTPGLALKTYNKKLTDLVGYDVVKEVVDEWIDDPTAKGIILLGPAGVGKTHLCQCLGGHYNRMVIEVEIAQMMGDGLVGQAEKAMKRALDVISANANPVAPIIVFVDEIEKGLAGTSSAGGRGGANDGGTTDRSNAQFLKFLSDARPPGIYLVATCNDIEKLPAAYVRAERWDTAPIFVDLPNAQERDAILAHYQKEYGVVARPITMEGWTGAEIKTWCRLARKKMDNKKNANDADELIVPVSRTMGAEIDYLRKWKDGRTIPASRKIAVADKNGAKSRKLDI